MVITKEETFAPVAPLYRFNLRGRGGQDGQRADFYGLDIGHIWRVDGALEYGIAGFVEIDEIGRPARVIGF